MADFLLELLSEEIPARMQNDAANQLQQRFEALLKEAGLSAGKVETHVTPRRLALLAYDLPSSSEATREERRGPRADAPEKAIEGFLKSAGLSRDELEERDDPKGRFLYAVIERPGQPVADILAAKLPAMIEGFQWPKSQRWGTASASTASPRWVRPLRKIVALLDSDMVPFSALGIESGRETEGHRFMSEGLVEVQQPAAYAEQLEKAYVLVDHARRRTIIGERGGAAAEQAELQLIADDGLEIENAGLTEWPVPLIGRFDPAYLEVPREVIELTMRSHQKYFSLNDANGELAPAFLSVANLETEDDGKHIVAGNERVLSARLADARFFWDQDLGIPLEEQAERLTGILFHEKLGTLAEKAERVRRLAVWLATEHFPKLDQKLVERAARLCKADLVTGTVGEFPELQGIAGGHLATAQGEDPAVAAALAEHYSHAPAGDVAKLVALADRVDTLVSFFNVDIRPTGSRDPFALRRAALSVIETIVSNGLRIALKPLFEAAGSRDADDLIHFFADRLKVQQREAGVRHDLIDAVFALGDENDLVRLLARVKALQQFLDTDDGRNLIAGYRRAANILRIEEKKEGQKFPANVDKALLTEPAEAELSTALDEAVTKANAALAEEDFKAAMAALASLRQPVDRFFDDVTVNADDPTLRRNRLSLLAYLRDTADQVADLSKVES